MLFFWAHTLVGKCISCNIYSTSTVFYICSFSRTRDTVCNHCQPLPTIIMCLEPMSPWELFVRFWICFINRSCLNVPCLLPQFYSIELAWNHYLLAMQHCISENKMTCLPPFHLLLTAPTNWGSPTCNKHKYLPQCKTLEHTVTFADNRMGVLKAYLTSSTCMRMGSWPFLT